MYISPLLSTPCISFVQGVTPVVTGLVIGHLVDRCIDHPYMGASAGACIGAFIDHRYLKGNKDRYPVARKMGNLMPCVIALMHYNMQIHSPAETLKEYDVLRMYVFNAQNIDSRGDFAAFFPTKNPEAMWALVERLAAVETRDNGKITVTIKYGNIDVPCVLKQDFAKDVLKIYEKVVQERAKQS